MAYRVAVGGQTHVFADLKTLMAKATPEVADTVSSALKRLIDSGRGGMGSMFKVIGISDPSIETLVALSDTPEVPA